MLRSVKAALIAATLTASALAFAPSPVQAATDYPSCDAMHRDYENGVAKNKKAAKKQVRSGHYRPAVRPSLYRANDESDADNDGTACEVLR